MKLYLLFLYFAQIANSQLFRVKYINETDWNQIEKKINLNGLDKENAKLCYFLNIKCESLSDPTSWLSHQ